MCIRDSRAAVPQVEFVDGGQGIARRIAYLTRDQSWPSEPSPGLILFTGPARRPSLDMLRRYGIEDIKSL